MISLKYWYISRNFRQFLEYILGTYVDTNITWEGLSLSFLIWQFFPHIISTKSKYVTSHLQDERQILWFPRGLLENMSLLWGQKNISNFFCLFLNFLATAWGILVPHPGMEPVPLGVEAWSLNHWTAREVNLFSNLMRKCQKDWTFNSVESQIIDTMVLVYLSRVTVADIKGKYRSLP